MLYALKDCANLRIDSIASKKTLMFVNYAKTTSLEFTSDQVFAQSKSVNAVRFDSNRAGTFKTTMEVFPQDIIPMLFGTAFGEKTAPWAKRELLQVVDGKATLAGTPMAGTLQVYKVNEDDKLTHIAEQVEGAVTAPNCYTITGSDMEFNAATFADGGYVACYYFAESEVKSFTIDNISFPGGYVIYGDTALRGTDQEDDFVQFKLHNVKPQSNASLSMDVDNVCTLEITWDVMSDAEGNMMTWSNVE